MKFFKFVSSNQVRFFVKSFVMLIVLPLFFLVSTSAQASLFGHCRVESDPLWQQGAIKIEAGRVEQEKGYEMFGRAQSGWYTHVQTGGQEAAEGRHLQDQARKNSEQCRLQAIKRQRLKEEVKKESLDKLKEEAKSKFIDTIESELPEEYKVLRPSVDIIQTQRDLFQQRGDTRAQLGSVVQSVQQIRNWPKSPGTSAWELSGELFSTSLEVYQKIVNSAISSWEKQLQKFDQGYAQRQRRLRKWVNERRRLERKWRAWKGAPPRPRNNGGSSRQYNDDSGARALLDALGTAAQIYGQYKGYNTPRNSGRRTRSTCPPGWRRTGSACSCGRTTTMGPSYAWNFYRSNGACRQ